MTYDLIATLHALNFDMTALNLIFDHLTGRKQRVQINSSFSSSGYISRRTARTTLRPAIIQSISLWLILICRGSWSMNYADVNTRYVCSEIVDVTLEKLEEVGKVFFEWFSNNCWKANADKCHFILSKDEPFSISIDNEIIRSLKIVTIKLLEVILNVMRKKLHALARIL